MTCLPNFHQFTEQGIRLCTALLLVVLFAGCRVDVKCDSNNCADDKNLTPPSAPEMRWTATATGTPVPTSGTPGPSATPTPTLTFVPRE